MGQGQEIIARKYMATATVEGQWVLLQNTHLGLGYLTEVTTLLHLANMQPGPTSLSCSLPAVLLILCWYTCIEQLQQSLMTWPMMLIWLVSRSDTVS